MCASRWPSDTLNTYPDTPGCEGAAPGYRGDTPATRRKGSANPTRHAMIAPAGLDFSGSAIAR